MKTQVLSQHTLDFFEARAAEATAMALITVIATEGSTYSKTGVQMLIDSNGESLGIVSGGCLESDLAEHAKRVMQTGVAQLVEYDLRADDELFGLGVGCEGLIRILIQGLLPKHDYQPFRMLGDCSSTHDTINVTLVVSSDFRDVAAGDVLVSQRGNVESWGCSAQHIDAAQARGDVETVTFNIAPPRQLLILGAGRDAEPVATMALLQGWNTTVVDHRPAYVETFDVAVEKHCVAAAELSRHIVLEQFDAVIVMSHHLQTDRAYLKALSGDGPGFVGLLGPPHRRDRIMRELGASADAFGDRLRAPVGTRLGGRGPAAIALEITAQLQQHFATLD